MNIAVFASHEGTDLQAIIDGCKGEKLDAIVKVVISNNKSSGALERARKNGITAVNLSQSVIPDAQLLENEILQVLQENEINLIFLAGYLKKLGTSILKEYEGRIFNIHPSLLPRHGGKGMYGIKVHKAVLNANEKETGITIHRVTEEYDDGEIIAQTIVQVDSNDTPEKLASRVLKREHIFIVEVLSDIINGKVPLGKKYRFYSKENI
jgi:phosphoribosylglycinamide formyltransferase, formyltetrahydrofolate-dependent